MFGHKTRGVAIVLTLLSLPASEAHACNWLRGCFGGGTTVNYAPAPYVASYAPAGCGQVVNYMPQTCYRTVYVQTPVVAYRPMSACDPCTGCPTTVMRPVTSCVMQPRLVPYTTYRPVVTAAYTASYAPACNSCAPAAPACNSCAPAAVATPTY